MYINLNVAHTLEHLPCYLFAKLWTIATMKESVDLVYGMDISLTA